MHILEEIINPFSRQIDSNYGEKELEAEFAPCIHVYLSQCRWRVIRLKIRKGNHGSEYALKSEIIIYVL